IAGQRPRLFERATLAGRGQSTGADTGFIPDSEDASSRCVASDVDLCRNTVFDGERGGAGTASPVGSGPLFSHPRPGRDAADFNQHEANGSLPGPSRTASRAGGVMSGLANGGA